MYLAPEILKTIVTYTPLVSIDLLVFDRQGRVLLGWRRNRPAQDCWFVPGGRIDKGEPLARAFQRITQAELGVALSVEQGTFRGVFEHFYQDCFLGDGVPTHYVVLAHELRVDLPVTLPADQHDRYCWLSPGELRENPQVHDYTKAYFQD